MEEFSEIRLPCYTTGRSTEMVERRPDVKNGESVIRYSNVSSLVIPGTYGSVV
jgi:hypothetical protein